MRVIVPGGYYSYDSAGKKIWLDYQYYGTTLENIERVKNLTRNKILYDYKRSTVLPTVENGCITHSYQGTEADTDKIQVILKTPITNSLTELTPVDGVVTLETDGKVLVLPTSNAAILPSYNEYVLNPNRLTIAESPFGGLKGSGSPDYAPGTLYTPTDGVYLTDVAGNNSTKTLTAGMLKGVNGLTVDTAAHTITEEFIVENTAESNNPTVIDDCSNATGWGIVAGSGSISSDGTQISINGTTDATGNLYAAKTLSAIDTTNFHFLAFQFTSSKTGTCYTSFGASANRVVLTKSVIENNISNMVWAYKSPATPAESTPSSIIGTPAWNAVSYIRIGYTGQPNTQVIFSCGAISIDSVKSAHIELQNPNNLSATSTIVQCWGGSAYAECRRDSLDGAYANISSTPANMKLLDGTKFDDVYGSGLGRAYFPKGASGETKAGSDGNITYSVNKGTRNRIGFRIDLPPSDGGRTNFNKIRLKVITNYAADAEGNYSASFDFADSTNTSYGLQNLSLPWIALYDPADSLIDFYLFTHRPQSLSFKKDENGTIYSLSLYPGTGSIYHGQIPFADLTLDTNSDSVPDCLEAAVNGSVTKFLQNYSMVI